LFFLNRWNESRPLEEKDRNLAKSFALRIIAGQLISGVWYYDGILLTPEKEAELLASLKAGTYKPSSSHSSYSISNTQFAILALWGARKHGVAVRAPLLAMIDHFNQKQFGDGHWIYSPENPDVLWTTSTCTGLIALALEKALLQDKEFVRQRQPSDPGKKKADLANAFAYLGKSIGRKLGDPGGAKYHLRGKIFQADAMGDLYFLWSVERVGMIYGQELIDKKPWYDWGYPIVMKTQNQENGSWNDLHGPVVDTCFALLFLKRANIAKDLADKLKQLSLEQGNTRVNERGQSRKE
jgi:hypothetical protein